MHVADYKSPVCLKPDISVLPSTEEVGIIGYFERYGPTMILEEFSEEIQAVPEAERIRQSVELTLLVSAALPPNVKVVSLGTIHKIVQSFIYHQCSTLKGASGSPLLAYSDDPLSFRGIHVSSVLKMHGQGKSNIAISVTNTTFQKYYNHIVLHV